MKYQPKLPLWPHQQQALAKMKGKEAYGLLLAMRTGKTPTLLADFGQMDHRMDIYHCGLLFLQVLLGQPLTFTREEVLQGAPRDLALKIGGPFSFALEKALRRHVDYRTASALEFWRDMNTPVVPAQSAA